MIETKRVLSTHKVLAAAMLGAALMGQAAQAKDVWVLAGYNGSNGPTDGSYNRPYSSINHAAWSAAQPGDRVMVRPGTYRETIYLKGGASWGWITYKSEIPRAAKIIGPAGGDTGAFHAWGGNNGTSKDASDGEPGAWNKWYGGKAVTPQAYINIDGFDITSEKTDGNGIWFQWAHHINIVNNKIYGCGGAGIGASLSDYITIENNEIHDNSTKTVGGYGSGISLWRTRPWDNNGGFHNKIRNNRIYHNYNNLNDNGRSDGNGIIIDTTLFDKATLIENNIIWDNGGAGIMLDAAANVTVRYNTLYKNSWDWQLRYPEIYLQEVWWEDGDPYTAGEQFSMEDGHNRNVRIYANIISARNDRLSVQINPGSVECYTYNNLRWYDATSPSNVPDFFPGHVGVQETYGGNDIVGSPNFIWATHQWNANFRLQSNSPAINKINWQNTWDNRDAEGVWRPRGSSNDYGAYESQ